MNEEERRAWLARRERCFAELQERTGLTTTQWGGMCPFQAEGLTPEGLEWYFRFRHDEATLYVFPVGGNMFDDLLMYAERPEATSAGWDRGELSEGEALALIAQLWAERRPAEEFRSTGMDRLGASVDAMVAFMKETKE